MEKLGKKNNQKIKWQRDSTLLPKGKNTKTKPFNCFTELLAL